MRHLFIALFALGAFFWWKGNLRTQGASASPDFRELVSSTTCVGKRGCLLVYVTPWCPACEQISPLIQSWQSASGKDKDYGVKVIVGLEQTPGDNERLAGRYGPHCLVDEDKKLHELLGVKHYPSIVLVENNGITKRDQEVIQWAVARYNSKP